MGWHHPHACFHRNIFQAHLFFAGNKWPIKDLQRDLNNLNFSPRQASFFASINELPLIRRQNCKLEESQVLKEDWLSSLVACREPKTKCSCPFVNSLKKKEIIQSFRTFCTSKEKSQIKLFLNCSERIMKKNDVID